MNATLFAVLAGLIALAVVIALFFGIRWAEGRELPEPVEHRHDEP